MTSDSIPPHDLASAALAKRIRLARSYLTETVAQRLLGVDEVTLRSWREEKRILAVWHEPVGAYLYPDFQFDQNGLIEQVPALLSCFDRYLGHVWEDTWLIVEWFISPHLLLDGNTPAEVLALDPRLVLEVGREDLLEDPGTLW